MLLMEGSLYPVRTLLKNGFLEPSEDCCTLISSCLSVSTSLELQKARNGNISSLIFRPPHKANYSRKKHHLMWFGLPSSSPITFFSLKLKTIEIM